MKMRVYSIFDKKVEAFGVPFFLPNDEAAKRATMDAASSKNTTLNRHPADFELWLLSEFDDQSGSFVDLDDDLTAKPVCTVLELMPKHDAELFPKEQEPENQVGPKERKHA